MNTIMLIRTSPLKWPYSVNQLAQDEPSKSISNNPLDQELQDYNCYRVIPVTPIIENPSIYKAVEIQPDTSEGPPYYQRWEIVEMTEEEKKAYYRQSHPPKWFEFINALPVEVSGMLKTALDVDALTALSLPVGIMEARSGDERLFLDSWATAKTAGLIPSELNNVIRDLAVSFDLPETFINGL